MNKDSGKKENNILGKLTQKKKRRTNLLRTYGLLLVFIILLIILLIISPNFRNPRNIVNLLQQNAVIGIIACGMTLMMISGGFDLSVGSTAALSGMVAAALFLRFSIPVGIIGGLAAAAFVGIINGLLIGKVNINPFVATLGMQIITRGALYVSTNAAPIYGLPRSYMKVGHGSIGPIPIATGVFVIIAIISHILLRHTPFGQYILSTGGNEEASRLSGINVDRIKITVFMWGGLLAGVGGLILLGQTNTGQPTAATGYELDAIAATVVGGTSLSGGQGSVFNTVLGVLLLGMVANALNLLNVSPYWQPVVTGIIILVAVGLDTMGKEQ
ncbi:MAG TPA: ABC transporter permease [Clostridia bacterium]|nr:ABC transporter permease [Clostridia bacterium]